MSKIIEEVETKHGDVGIKLGEVNCKSCGESLPTVQVTSSKPLLLMVKTKSIFLAIPKCKKCKQWKCPECGETIELNYSISPTDLHLELGTAQCDGCGLNGQLYSSVSSKEGE